MPWLKFQPTTARRVNSESWDGVIDSPTSTYIHTRDCGEQNDATEHVKFAVMFYLSLRQLAEADTFVSFMRESDVSPSLSADTAICCNLLSSGYYSIPVEREGPAFRE